MVRLIVLCLLVILTSCNEEKVIEKVVEVPIPQNVVPRETDIEKYPWAKAELAEHIALCGAGVVEGAGGENRCEYTIRVDELFTTHPNLKTGFIEDPDLMQANGVQFVTATDEMIKDVPESWSFLELGKASEVKINTQVCGDCWSQATTKALEYMIAAHDNKLEELSVQTQISTCSNHGSCNGGYMSAPDFLIRYGNPFEVQDPYQGRNSSCKFDMSRADFKYKLKSAPYVGSSLMASRAHRGKYSGPKVSNIKAMMVKYKSPAVTTIAAISSSGGVIDSCSAINSGGNHMQVIVGWYPHPHRGGYETAVLNNSWGTSHGQNGFTHIRWECGEGRLNRGVGRSARVYEYEPECSVPDAYTGPDRDILLDTYVKIGKPMKAEIKCRWSPAEGLEDPLSCETLASPKMTTEYHLEVSSTGCAGVTKSAMVLIRPIGPIGPVSKLREHFGGLGLEMERVLTPFGEVNVVLK